MAVASVAVLMSVAACAQDEVSTSTADLPDAVTTLQTSVRIPGGLRALDDNLGPVIRNDDPAPVRAPRGGTVKHFSMDDPYRWEAVVTFAKDESASALTTWLMQLSALDFVERAATAIGDSTGPAPRCLGTFDGAGVVAPTRTCTIGAEQLGGGGSLNLQVSPGALEVEWLIERKFDHRMPGDSIGEPYPATTTSTPSGDRKDMHCNTLGECFPTSNS